jgi:hypothetical protein
MPSRNPQNQLTNSVIMIQPIDFGYNEQTGVDNEFQSKPSKAESNNLSKVIFSEFNSTVATLNNLGIEVLLLGKEHTDKSLPDALFPNNWFSTRSNGELHIYPMKTQNRQDEVQILQLSKLLTGAGYQLNQTYDLRGLLPIGSVLEGTGSLIFHHPNKVVFAALSERCQIEALSAYAEKFNYQSISFETLSENNHPIYHSNVMMSCGEDFAVVTQQIINKSKQTDVLNQLSNYCNDIIIINEVQMSQHFCGNILQLKDTNNQPVIAMSQSAYSGFTLEQKKVLEKHGSLAICAIPTIERIGGGSTRCMLAENFLTKINP